MSTDDEPAEGGMEKINVRVPAGLLAAIDDAWEVRGYATRSEAIRDALRDWASPSATLFDEILAELEASRSQRERGAVVPAEEARERLGFGADASSSLDRFGLGADASLSLD